MKLFKKILGVFIGTLILGLGVALCKTAALGQDPLSAAIFSIVYLFDELLPYSVWYIIVNSIFLLFMILFLRKKINLGTLMGLVFIGIFSDMFCLLFTHINFIPINFIVRLLISILGIFVTCLGIAFYGSANLGLSPYDALSVIISNTFKKIKFQYARIICDVTCTLIALIVGVIFLKRSDLININTIICFIVSGPLITFFSKLSIKYYYKEENNDFN